MVIICESSLEPLQRLLKHKFIGFFLLLTWTGAWSQGHAQTVYEADGEPLAVEEEIRWLLNRARFDRDRENARRGTSFNDIPMRSGPLAPNAALTRSARRHIEDLARSGRFQHETVPGSLYYNPSRQKKPWDRMSAEGYVWDLAGENIAAGYTTAVGVYLGWWHSGGHRRNMGNKDFAEIGNGHHFRASSIYKDYYGMNLGRSGSARFFTDTLFHDSNGNGAYNKGEGRAGIRVLLLLQNSLHPHCDVSTTAGSFAVPIQSIPLNTLVRVVLENTNAHAVTLSLPRDAGTLETLVLGPSESRVCGGFTKGSHNVGFRDLAPAPVLLALSPSARTHDAEGSEQASVSIISSSAWSAVSNAPWLRVINSGQNTGDGTLTYSVDPHDFGDPRTGFILITSEEHGVSLFNVTQTGVPAELVVATAPETIPASGQTALHLHVSANVTWQAASTAHWITLVNEHAVGNGSLVFHVAPNVGSLARTTQIAVSGGGLTRLIEVRQEAGGMPIVAQHLALDLTEGGGTLLKVTGLPPGTWWDKAGAHLRGQPSRSGVYTLHVEVRMPGGGISRRVITLVVEPLPDSAVGVFEARVSQTPTVVGRLGGELRFTTSASGWVSGVLRVQGRSLPFRDRLIHQPGDGVFLRRTFLPNQPETMVLELHLRENHHCEGSMISSGAVAEVHGWRRIWHAVERPVPESQQGRFHVLGEVRPPWRGEPSVPQGFACAVLTVASNGRAAWSGRLGDGSSLLRAGWLGPAGESGCWALLYRATGSIFWQGRLQEGAFSGEAFWVKDSLQPRGTRAYRNGFGLDERGQVALQLAGETWTKPAAGQSLADMMGLQGLPFEWAISFEEGVIADTSSPVPSRLLGLDHRNQFILPPPGSTGNESRLRLRINAHTGWLHGGFSLFDEHPGRPGAILTRSVSFEGLLLPASRRAGGFFVADKLAAPQFNPHQPRASSDRVSGAMRLQAVDTW